MKKIYFTLICFIVGNLYAQNITNVEYFFDSDPGFGQATSLEFDSGPEIDITADINISNLSDGFHVLYIRAKDDSARWSICYSRPYLKEAPSEVQPVITAVEYFIDNDPGPGEAEAVSITGESDIALDINADLNEINEGFHIMYMRAKDNAGKWSIPYSRPFIKDSPPLPNQISAIEYFFSKGDSIFPLHTYSEFTSAHDVDISFDADMSDLNGMDYRLHVMGIDESGLRSIEYTHLLSEEEVNSAPIISGLPDDFNFSADSSLTILIWDYVFDAQTADSLLEYSFDVGNDSLIYQFNDTTGQLTLSALSGYHGRDSLRISATDGVLSDTAATDVNIYLPSGIIDNAQILVMPKAYSLRQNYPNPFNPSTKIVFDIPQAGKVKIDVYNILGSHIKTILDRHKVAGSHSVEFRANHLPSGLYFYVISAGSFRQVKKMTLIK